ncbi:MAG: DUF6089 family protein [Bacteroidia bacterium]|nr:DUF6089 family protein [Bacteroidia bacterium]
MKKVLIIALTCAWFVAGISSVFSQRGKGYTYFSVGPSLGTTNYKGDLDDDFTLKFTKFGLGAMGYYQFHPHMSLRLNFSQGWMGASDSVTKNFSRNYRNLSFRSPITELSVQLIYDFFGSNRRYKYRRDWTPFAFTGVGVFTFNPKAKANDGKWYALQPLGTEGQYLVGVSGTPKPYSLTQICIPIGVGVKRRLSEKWDLRVEIGMRKVFTDYLDDVSDKYANPEEMYRQMGAIAFELADRSNYVRSAADPTQLGRTLPFADRARDGQGRLLSGYWQNDIRGFKSQDDWYVYSCVSVSYILDFVRCPKFGN